MATVYKAYHAATERYVALKALPHQFAQSKEFLARFKQEARLIANLEHAHILHVHDYGESGGIPYLVMRFLDTGTLKDHIKPGPLPLKDIDRIFTQVAEALAYAHKQGVIHRDIKPSNILVDQHNNAFLTDFGIAKLVEGTLHLTASGAITGTPAYMSPEQGEDKPVDQRTDIYSLGVMLYEMLTRQVPYEAETPMAIIIKHMQAPLPPPSTINPNISPEIEAVLLKALSKNPLDRYPSVQEFLLAWKKALSSSEHAVEGATIDIAIPQPRTMPHPRLKWLLPLVGVCVVALAISLFLGLHLKAPSQPTSAPAVAEIENTTTPYTPVITPMISPTIIPSPLSKELMIIVGLDAGPVPAGARGRLGKGKIASVVISPEGDTLAVGSSLGIYLYRTDTVEFINLIETGNFVNSVAFSPDGATIASASSDNTIDLWDVRSEEHLRTLQGHSRGVNSVVFSPDGTSLASGDDDGKVVLWDARTGQPKFTFEGHTEAVNSVAFSPDGAVLASASNDESVILWDIPNQKERSTLKGHSGWVNSVAFSPDGNTLASGSWDDTVILWDVQSGKQLHTLTGHKVTVYSVAFSSYGNIVASSSLDDNIILWDAQSGEQLRIIKGHTNSVISIAFSPEDTTLASGAEDGTAILWDSRTGARLNTIKGYSHKVTSIAYAPDGLILAAGSYGKAMILWDALHGERLYTLEGIQYIRTPVSALAFSPIGDMLAVGTYSGANIWDTQNWVVLQKLEADIGEMVSMAFSPQGDILVGVTSRSGKVFLWDPNSGELVRTFENEQTLGASSMAYSPRGDSLALGVYGKVVLWDQNDEVRTLEGHKGQVNAVSFAPDGSTLASGANDKKVIVWDALIGKQISTLEGHKGWIYSLAFSQEGDMLASGDNTGIIILWDVHSENRLQVLEGHTGRINSVSFSPDGRTLASGSDDGTIVLWEIVK